MPEKIQEDQEPAMVTQLGYFIHFVPVAHRQKKSARIAKSAEPLRREIFRCLKKYGPAEVVTKLGEEHEELIWTMFHSRPEVFGRHNYQEGKNAHQS
jgi:hypothetical protein